MLVVAWCYFWMSVFACAVMVGLPVGCAVGMTASLGTIVLLVLRRVCSWLLEWTCQAFHAGVRAAQVCLVLYVSHAIPPLPRLPLFRLPFIL